MNLKVSKMKMSINLSKVLGHDMCTDIFWDWEKVRINKSEFPFSLFSLQSDN